MNYPHIEDAARVALAELGLLPPRYFEHDKFLIVDAADGKPGNGAGRLKIFADGQGGFAQNWSSSSGEKRLFFLNAEAQTTAQSKAERERIEAERRRRLAKEEARKQNARRRAWCIWQEAQAAPANHPYLIRKQIKPNGAKVGRWQRTINDAAGNPTAITVENALLIPMYCSRGTIESVQAIFPERHQQLGRDKDFLPGGGLAGLFWWIGAKTETVIISEGFATAATLHEQTGNRVYLAFTANNLLSVAQIVREKLHDTAIILAADNDTKTAGNPGLTKATKAANAVDGTVIVPPIPNADFNDYQIFLNGGGHV